MSDHFHPDLNPHALAHADRPRVAPRRAELERARYLARRRARLVKERSQRQRLVAALLAAAVLALAVRLLARLRRAAMRRRSAVVAPR